MAPLTADLAKRLERLPRDLRDEFPEIPFETIAHDVDSDARELMAGARFNDFVPVLVHRAVRERLRSRA